MGWYALREKNREEWSKWDWTKKDIELAAEHNLTRERVRQIRAELLLGSSRDVHRTLPSKIKADPAYYKELFSKHTKKELVSILGVGYFTIQKASREFDLPTLSPDRNPWHLVDFNLPNQVIEEIWGIDHQVTSNYRREHGKSRSPYWIARGRPTDNPVYTALVEKQTELAYKWKNRQITETVKTQETMQTKTEKPTKAFKVSLVPMRRALVDIVRSRKIPFNHEKAKEMIESVATMPYFYINYEGAGFASADTLGLKPDFVNSSFEEITEALVNWSGSFRVPNDSIEIRLFNDGRMKIGGYVLDSKLSETIYQHQKKVVQRRAGSKTWVSRKQKAAETPATQSPTETVVTQ